MTRQHGVVDSAGGIIPFGHLGWGYHDRVEFLARAAEYIADGLAQNQWVEYVGAGSREELRAQLDTIPLDTARVTVTPAEEFYGLADCAGVVDPLATIASRGQTLENALALGYSGVRVITDATAVTATPEQRDAFARLEFLFDQEMAGQRISALCAYDTTRLGDDACGLICLHPLVGGASPSFRLYAQPDAAFALGGEIDAATFTTFTTALQRICPVVDGEEVIIDAKRLGFITHRELCALDDQARQQSRGIVFRDASPLLVRLAELVTLTNIRVDPADESAPGAS